MTAAATQELITSSVTDFGASALVVLGAIVAVGVGFIVFKMGWNKLKSVARG